MQMRKIVPIMAGLTPTEGEVTCAEMYAQANMTLASAGMPL